MAGSTRLEMGMGEIRQSTTCRREADNHPRARCSWSTALIYAASVL
jgi:hypothetical protein